MPRYQKSAGFNKINADKIIATQSTADSMQVAGTTQSTSTTTGAITTNGGVGIVKDVFIGGDLDLTGDLTVDGNLDVAGTVVSDGSSLKNFLIKDSTNTGLNGSALNGEVMYVDTGTTPSTVLFSRLTVDHTDARAIQVRVGNNGTKVFTIRTDTTPGQVNIIGDLDVVGDITLPSTGATASALNFYAEGTHTTNWTGIWSSDQAGNIKWTRVGNMVCLTFPSVRATSDGSVASIDIATVLPTYLRPTDNSVAAVPLIVNAGAGAFGVAVISTSGVINVYIDAAFGTFSGTSSGTGFRNFSITYSV